MLAQTNPLLRGPDYQFVIFFIWNQPQAIISEGSLLVEALEELQRLERQERELRRATAIDGAEKEALLTRVAVEDRAEIVGSLADLYHKTTLATVMDGFIHEAVALRGAAGQDEAEVAVAQTGNDGGPEVSA